MQVRFLLRERDEKGMTFIMHAVNARSDDTRMATITAKGPTNEVSSATPPATPDPPVPGQQPDETNVPPTPDQLNTEEVVQLDPWVPVISSVLEFAKKVMWRADVSTQKEAFPSSSNPCDLPEMSKTFGLIALGGYS